MRIQSAPVERQSRPTRLERSRALPLPFYSPANAITAIRALIVVALATFLWSPARPETAALTAMMAIVAVALDGADGWLARRTGTSSAFGARFDMEVDALLILVLAALVWTYDKAGAWVLLSGALRYLFVAAGWIQPWLSAPLPPSQRRRVVCVVQIGGLIIAIAPQVTPPFSALAAAMSLLALVWSFFVDVRWARRQREKRPSEERESPRPSANAHSTRTKASTRPLRAYVSLATALVLLNVALTFKNIWPTPAIRWDGALSVELGMFLLAAAAAAHWHGGLSRRVCGWLAALVVVLALGRYAEVTAPALFGRDINLYWDIRHLASVAGMLTEPASWGVLTLVVALVLIVPASLYLVAQWALRVVVQAMARRGERRAVVSVGLLLVGLFVAQRSQTPAEEWKGWTDQRLAGVVDLPTPVIYTFARQARLALRPFFVDPVTSVGASPRLDYDIAALDGTDVILFFVESYGAISYDNPGFRAALQAPRAQLAEDIRATGRHVVSAFVQSPTFGGGSWLAHISLLSGIDVADEDTNHLLLTQRRDTMVTSFARQRFRTVAVMPGLQQGWPEGEFYRFDTVYGEQQLDYRGPQFGWWNVPDQFSLAQLDTRELRDGPRAPVFAVLVGISTHTPFSPTAPYQAHWPRLLSDAPYDAADEEQAFAREPDWLNLGPSYVGALRYVYASLGGYLRYRPNRDLVLVVVGDHQPPAMVTGQGASWDVPVHVIASRPQLLDALRAEGFQPGIDVRGPALSRMHALLPVLLRSFSHGGQPKDAD